MAHALSTRPIISVRNLTVAVLVLWFLLAVAGSLLGVFDSEPRPPLPLGLAAVVPVALFAVSYLTSVRFRELVWSLDLRLLTLAHTWRVGGIVFLILLSTRGTAGSLRHPRRVGRHRHRHHGTDRRLVLETPIPSLADSGISLLKASSRDLFRGEDLDESGDFEYLDEARRQVAQLERPLRLLDNHASRVARASQKRQPEVE